jgi:hypothetical protein
MMIPQWTHIVASERRELHDFPRLPISGVSGSPDYGDKQRRDIGTADPGAVPGGSTKTGPPGPALTGPNQDRRVLKSAVLCSEWDHRDGPYTSANDNEALAIAA